MVPENSGSPNINGLLPDQSGNSGKFLTTILKITGNGTNANDVVFEFWKVTKVAAS